MRIPIRRRVAAAGTAVLLLTSTLFAAAPATAADNTFQPASFGKMIVTTGWRILSGEDPAAPAPGVNRWDCEPDAAHPDPVVLLHGLNGNQYNGWANIGPRLANAGYCVFSLNYGGTNAFDGGTKPVQESAAEIGAFIDEVRSRTGAAKVDIVGHSEGGFMSLYVPKTITGMAAKVDTVVAMAPPTHGTDLHGVTTIVDALGLRHLVKAFCAACDDILVGGAGVVELNDGPIAQPGVTYTTIISKRDPAITPYTSAAIGEEGVTDIVVQDHCPNDLAGHSGIAYDSSVMSMISNALDPADPQPIDCGSGPPI